MTTVVLEVRSLASSLDDVATAMQAGIADDDARIAFASPELLWKVLSANRWALLKQMAGLGPVSIREVARRCKRDVRAVHRDVTALLRAGVIERNAVGQVVFPYDAIRVEFELRAA